MEKSSTVRDGWFAELTLVDPALWYFVADVDFEFGGSASLKGSVRLMLGQRILDEIPEGAYAFSVAPFFDKDCMRGVWGMKREKVT